MLSDAHLVFPQMWGWAARRTSQKGRSDRSVEPKWCPGPTLLHRKAFSDNFEAATILCQAPSSLTITLVDTGAALAAHSGGSALESKIRLQHSTFGARQTQERGKRRRSNTGVRCNPTRAVGMAQRANPPPGANLAMIRRSLCSRSTRDETSCFHPCLAAPSSQSSGSRTAKRAPLSCHDSGSSPATLISLPALRTADKASVWLTSNTTPN